LKADDVNKQPSCLALMHICSHSPCGCFLSQFCSVHNGVMCRSVLPGWNFCNQLINPFPIIFHTYVHACMHPSGTNVYTTYMHTCMHAYMYACMYAYIHTYIHACMYACMCACMYVYVRTYVHTGWPN